MKYKITVTHEFDSDSSYTDVCDTIATKHIERQLAEGNTWAWCVVKVSLIFPDFELSEYLAGCSYVNEDDFILNSGYYEDMVNTMKETVIDAAKILTN